ncbi:MAG: PQQ-dependent sugar dehydrogenase, partial [Bryobacteraceae bacterium]
APNAFPSAPKIPCDPGNGGLKLPPGFCAAVVADGIGHARHLAVAPNGDLYVALQSRGDNPGGVVALGDPNSHGHYGKQVKITTGSTTGTKLHNGYLYVAHPTSVERFKMKPGQLKPVGGAETVVKDLPVQHEHRDKGIAFDRKGNLYINVGAPSNACQVDDRQKGSPGQDPCPLLKRHGGIWKFNANQLNQTQADGTRYATGLRQMPAITWHDGALYVVMNNRDQLNTLWPGKFTAKENADRPAEPMYRIKRGANYGWPYCFYDYEQKKLFLNPEYGGNGKKQGRCTQYALPIASYPAHLAPMDIMFYTGKQFPAHYRSGAFIAFHGSWNRAPLPQRPSNVTFQPFSGKKPSGKSEIFASGFAGKKPLMNPDAAAARANGVAQGPDGSLYIADSVKGKIWRVFYRGK